MIYVSWRIINFLYDGHVLHSTSEHPNHSLTSIHRLFSRGGKYCIGLCGQSSCADSVCLVEHVFIGTLFRERKADKGFHDFQSSNDEN